MWEGWVSYGGNEIINVARVEAYAANANLSWFKALYGNDSLAPILGDATYLTPLQDDAPWADPTRPESYGFYGVYPLSVTGVEDSSRSSVVTESLGDGGVAGALRHASKSVVFNTVLIGEDDAALDYGLKWLKQALLPGPCADLSELCYLAAEPAIDLTGVQVTLVPGVPVAPADIDGGTASSVGSTDYDGGAANDDGIVYTVDLDGGTAFADTFQVPAVAVSSSPPAADCFDPLARSLHNVQFNSGPTVTGKNKLTGGAAAWTVTFTAVATQPWEFGSEVEVIEGFLDPAVPIPWAGGVVPDGGYLDLDGHIFNEKACAVPELAPLTDPLCPALIPPPLPPLISLGCYSPPPKWRRRQITIPASYIPLWGEVVPKFAVHARTTDVRNLRLRFYADVDSDGDISDDPCAYCGDIVVSYVPLGNTLVFDASQGEVYVIDATQRRRRADTVVFDTDGSPFSWPVLSCGMGYIVTLDLPQTQHPPVFDLSLYARAA